MRCEFLQCELLRLAIITTLDYCVNDTPSYPSQRTLAGVPASVDPPLSGVGGLPRSRLGTNERRRELRTAPSSTRKSFSRRASRKAIKCVWAARYGVELRTHLQRDWGTMRGERDERRRPGGDVTTRWVYHYLVISRKVNFNEGTGAFNSREFIETANAKIKTGLSQDTLCKYKGRQYIHAGIIHSKNKRTYT